MAANRKNMQIEFDTRLHLRMLERDAKKNRREAEELMKKASNLMAKGDQERAKKALEESLQQSKLTSMVEKNVGVAGLSLRTIKAQNMMNRNATLMEKTIRISEATQKQNNPERNMESMERLRALNEEFAVTSSIYQDAINYDMQQTVPEDLVQEMMAKMAADLGVQLDEELAGATPSKAELKDDEPTLAEPSAEAEDALQQRLRALRE